MNQKLKQKLFEMIVSLGCLAVIALATLGTYYLCVMQ